ncbi:hypothetical protein C8R45DRAFT_1207841 [Mycena sanguinolenta]|nr:hypothetical protein C8R45DRAFT_1207841 [Mycena sanguinolenta]
MVFLDGARLVQAANPRMSWDDALDSSTEPVFRIFGPRQRLLRIRPRKNAWTAARISKPRSLASVGRRIVWRRLLGDSGGDEGTIARTQQNVFGASGGGRRRSSQRSGDHWAHIRRAVDGLSSGRGQARISTSRSAHRACANDYPRNTPARMARPAIPIAHCPFAEHVEMGPFLFSVTSPLTPRLDKRSLPASQFSRLHAVLAHPTGSLRCWNPQLALSPSLQRPFPMHSSIHPTLSPN